MLKRGFNLGALPQEVVATRGDEWTDVAGLRGPHGPVAVWTPRLTPILTLLQEILADLFEVRDHVPQAQHCRGRHARAVNRQYEQDLQWIASPEEQAPFSFVWVCQALGLEASAVRRRYLSGQPVSLPQRHRASITLGHLRLESVPRRAGKARAPRHTAALNGRGPEGNGTEPAPQ
jgi:hypothetical protein